jgi:hypothetical protein
MTSESKAVACKGKASWIGENTVEISGELGSIVLSSYGPELSQTFNRHQDKRLRYLLISKEILGEIKQQGIDIEINLNENDFMAIEQMQEANKRIAHRLMLGRISLQIAPILISYAASLPQIKEWLTKSQWLKQISSPNEILSQRLLGSAVGYRRFLVESCILGLANTLESAFLIINDEYQTKFKKVYDQYFDDLLYVKDIRMIYRCNNIIKHHRSIIPATSNPNGKFLIEVCRFKEGDDVAYLPIDIPKQFCHTYIFLLDLLRKLTSISQPLLVLSEEERYGETIKRFTLEASSPVSRTEARQS